MLKTVFFDRDGIINEVVMRGTVVGSPRTIDELTIKSDFTALYQVLLYRCTSMFVVSNQPDVARGLLQPSMLDEITERIQQQFSFGEVVYCKHDDNDHCDCRKPKPGMIIYLVEKFGLARDEAVFIGDSPKDILAGQAAGIRTILLSTGYNRSSEVKGDYTVSSLEEVLRLPL